MATFAIHPQTQAAGDDRWLPMPTMPASRMMVFLGAACRDLRLERGTKAVRVAARVNKSEAAVTRFEKGVTQPDDIDGMITAFSDELEVEPTVIWQHALQAWTEAPDDLNPAIPAPPSQGQIQRLAASRRKTPDPSPPKKSRAASKPRSS